MNFVALQWLRKVNPALIAIVKTEYSTELRADTQLADLVPRIAPNIESLLKRYDRGSITAKINIHEDETVDANATAVNKTWESRGFQNQANRGRGGTGASYRGRGRGQQGRGRSAQPQSRGQGPFCPGCYYLSQQLGTTIHFRHTPGDCPRKAVAVKMFQMEDAEYFGDTLTPVSMGDHLTTTNSTCGLTMPPTLTRQRATSRTSPSCPSPTTKSGYTRTGKRIRRPNSRSTQGAFQDVSNLTPYPLPQFVPTTPDQLSTG